MLVWYVRYLLAENHSLHPDVYAYVIILHEPFLRFAVWLEFERVKYEFKDPLYKLVSVDST